MKKIILTSILVALAAAGAFAQQRDTLAMPYGNTMKASVSTGNTFTLKGSALEGPVVSDLRNRLTGLIPGLEVTESGGSMFTSATGGLNSYSINSGAYSLNMKNLSSIYCIVDDIPVPFNQLLLDPNQIESVTVLSDVLDKAKYGPLASYGALCIKTKGSGYNKPLRITADVESGVSLITDVPEWVNGYEYAVMNNYARESAGLNMLYDDDYLEGIKVGDPNNLYTPNVDYRSLMLKNFYPTTRMSFSATAGSSNIRYNIAANAIHTGDIVKENTGDYNKLNLVASVATKIGRYIEASASFKGLVSYREKGNTSWYAWRSVPAIAYPLILDSYNLSDIDQYNATGEKTVYGVSKTFETNYYAKMMEGGTYTTRNRSGFFDVAFDVDWSWLLKGLKSRTMMEYSSFLSTTIGKSNDYIAYYWDSALGIQEISSHEGTKQTSRNVSSNATGQDLAFYHRFDYDWTHGGHSIKAGLTSFISNAAQTGDSYYQKQLYFVGNAAWNYMDKYSVELAGQYAGSSRFKEGARFGFFPAAGFRWNIHNEPFLAGIKNTLSKLSLHAQAGKLGSSDIYGSQYLYQANYSTTSGMTYGPSINGGDWWFGTNTHTSKYTTISRLANSELTWATISQVDLGLDAQLFGCLDLGASWYAWKRSGIIADVTDALPIIYGLDGTSVYDNYEEVSAQGFILSASYNKAWGDFRLGAGVSCTLPMGGVYYDKLVSDNYSYEYQKKTGTSSSDIWGYRCIGKYESQEQIDQLPSYVAKSELQVGDLIYKDENGDGSIDSNDRTIIGTSAASIKYSVNLNFGWRNFDLGIIATGRQGGDVNLVSNSYFTGGQGQGNYSAFMRDELGGDYPRLSYNDLTNNFLQSDFWLRDASWFKIQSVDLGYTIPMKSVKNIQSVRLDLRGDNLLSFKTLEYVDPEDTDAGITAYPFMRTVTLGAKIIF